MTFDFEDARARVGGLERVGAAELRELVAAIARPRLTGSDGAAQVEEELRTRFRDLGYDAEDLDFSFSTWPGRYGLPLGGGLLLVTSVAGALLIRAGLPGLALVVLLLGMVGAVLPALTLDRSIPGLPWGRVETRNLLFQRPDARPSWLLMAHRDSKSQLVPSLLRTVALIAAAVAWLGLVVLAALWISGPPLQFPGTVVAAAVVLGVAGLSLVLSWAGDDSPGALDNATGVAALLAVAARLKDRGDVAFLLTDGEELGLAGARAVVEQLPPVQGVINVDGLDDDGRFYVAEGTGWRRRGSAPQLAAALLTAAQVLDLAADRRRLPRSLLVDHQPLAAAGIPALTLLRGSWGSLMRVHRPSDSADRLRGEGAAKGATLLTATFHLLRHTGGGHLAAQQGGGA